MHTSASDSSPVFQLLPLHLRSGEDGRPVLIAEGLTHANGLVMIYADWCPYCQIFMPIFRKFSESRRREGLLLAVLDSESAVDVFAPGEVQAFPTFKRIRDGKIDRVEVAVDRSSEEAAFRTLDRIVGDMEGDDSSSDEEDDTTTMALVLEELRKCRRQIEALTAQAKQVPAKTAPKPKRTTKKTKSAKKRGTTRRRSKKSL